MKTIIGFLKRNPVIIVLAIGTAAFLLLDTYPVIASLSLIAVLLIILIILGINHVDIKSRFEKWRERAL